MEHWEELAPGCLRFVYGDGAFRPGTDTFLLSSLPRLRPGLRVCDLGCGPGLLGLLLLQRQPDLTVTGVELSPAAAELAEKAVSENALEARMRILRGDLRRIRDLLPAGGMDLVVCNPPYYPAASGYLAADSARRQARGEVDCTLEEVCGAAAWLLHWGGSLCLVHKPERLTDLLCAMRTAKLEPKRLRMVCTAAGNAPSLVLAEGRRGGKPGLDIGPPLILRQSDGTPTAELDAIYFRRQEDVQ